MFLLFLEILLSVFMVLNCVVLVFLVLMQLPKKEAGAGVAFGGAATDALFGAGSGNFLTKATKYTAGIFFVLAIVLSLIQSYRVHHVGANFLQQMKEQSRPTITAPPPPAQSAPAAQPGSTANTNLLLAPIESATNAAPTTTAPANTGSTNPAPQK